jgi:ParB family transcriptional regulator, chromosome partitioning protein
VPKQRFGLGRGLDALIPGTSPIDDDTPLDTSVSPSALFEVPVDAISANPHQPRGLANDDEDLMQLAESVQQYGLLQPLLVAVVEEDEQGAHYALIAGERRWRAAQIAGLERVPVVIKEATPQLMLEMALVENLQRTDLNPLELAAGYTTLMEEYKLTQDEIAQRVGRHRSTVANTVRLLGLPEVVRGYLITMPKVFTEGHARAVLQVNGEAERVHAAQKIIADQMSVRQAEELARTMNAQSLILTPDRRGGKERPQSYEIRQLEDEFRRATEMKVRLQQTTKGKGTLTLYFANQDQLQLLYQLLVAARSAGGVSTNALDLSELGDMLEASGFGRANGNGNGAHGPDPAATSSDSARGLDDTFDVTIDDD